MAELGDTLTTLLAQNQAWSEVMKEVDSSFFDQLSSSHKPKCFLDRLLRRSCIA